MRILAVDDDLMILELLETAMSISGDYEVCTASSGEKALEILEQDHDSFDCFLLDIQMPGIDGTILCRRIREMAAYKRTPIIMATAMSQKSHIDRAFVAGASDYIMKPFDFTELETRIETACKVATTRPRTQSSTSSFDTIQKVLNNSLAQSLEEPFEVGNVEGMVGYVAFQNYLLTLSITSLLATSVHAVKIANIDEVYSLATPIEFRGIVAKVGQIISVSVASEGEDCIFTYWGNGTFLCLHQNKSKLQLAGFETGVMDAASAMARRDGWDQTDKKTPHIVVGPMTSMKFLNKSSTLKRAINSVEKRCIRAKEVGDVFDQATRTVNDDDLGPTSGRESYADILREYLREDTSELRGRV